MIGLSWASGASADPINYGDFLGVNPGEPDFLQVTEDSISDPAPLFGAPIHAGSRLLFLPTSFAASAADGNYDGTTGTITAHIRAADGYYLQTVDLREIGDCTLLGAGSLNTWADIYGFLGATDVSPGTHGSFAAFLSIAPEPPYWLPPPLFTSFEGTAQINLAGLGITEITLAFTDTLEGNSEPGTTVFLQKKAFAIEVTSIPVPEPASGLSVLLGMFALLTRRLHRGSLL